MLVLSRKEGEVIRVGKAVLTVQRIRGRDGNRQVVLGIDAPDDILVLRGELADSIQEQPDGDGADGAGGEPGGAGD